MQVFGIDFTSAPQSRKPITCAVGRLDGVQLHIEQIDTWSSFEDFERFLGENRVGYTGIDLPLGQPSKLVKALGWPQSWQEYVQLVGGMSKGDFVETITHYCQQQPAGDKHHLRATDRLAVSCSPMMLYGVPVGKMFFEGAPRIAKARLSVLPCRPNAASHVIAEAYPAMAARRVIGKRAYKNDTAETQKQKRALRRQLIRVCTTPKQTPFAVTIDARSSLLDRAVKDGSGDVLDAILCALQIASAYAAHGASLGIPAECDPIEGWILGSEKNS